MNKLGGIIKVNGMDKHYRFEQYETVEEAIKDIGNDKVLHIINWWTNQQARAEAYSRNQVKYKATSCP